MLTLPKIYAITDRTISNLSHSEQVRQLANGGIGLIQVREKHQAPAQWIEDAVNARRIAREMGAVLIVNDRVDIAMVVEADGVHLGQTDIPAVAARGLLGPEKIIGLSTHTIEQARAAMLQPVDYIAFGPIFATATKTDPDKVTGLDQLREVRAIVGKMPLVAIGGIDDSNAGMVLAAGADSVAVISCLLRNDRSIADSSCDLMRSIAKQS